MWLVQTLLAAAKWMNESDFSSQELKQILLGTYASEKESKVAAEQKLRFLNALHEQLKPHFLTPNAFLSEQSDQRSAQLIHRSLLQQPAGPISAMDSRIINFDPALTRSAAYRAIHQLPIVTQEDFLGLGVGEKMLDVCQVCG